jgi:CheY-like chemotaxis protein/AraC-like DNA-binding protein
MATRHETPDSVVRFATCVEDVLRARGIDHPIVAATLQVLDREFASRDLRLRRLAQDFTVVPSHLSNEVKLRTGRSFSEHRRARRMWCAVAKLSDPTLPICEISRAVGYAHPSDFDEAFKRFFGVTPSRYRLRLTAAGATTGAQAVARNTAHSPSKSRNGEGQRSTHVSQKGAVSANRPSILIVDDDEGMRDTFARVLRLEGFLTQTASTGAAALEIIERARPDVVVTDYWMAPIDGLELIRRIRARCYPAPRLGLMTADILFDWDTRTELQRSGVAVVDKPIWTGELVSFVRGLLTTAQDVAPRAE